ncbi:hypothetical protein GGGNBK_21250 [Sporosarcina sp. ANT_H38]|uniref:hypothetical protein n=1 Tax=Sporosarcina sp. ANT_H38 TaxID=2597358 RepID=UPI00165E3FA7|nr:hypothetical protein [Sporosarcina sp. ANT_H38]
MARFLVRYTHVEETTYEQWVEAVNSDEALEKINDEADFKEIVEVQGVRMKDFEVIEED